MGGWALSFFLPFRGVWNSPSTSLESQPPSKLDTKGNSLLRKLSPCVIDGLFLDERGKVKCFVILVRLGTRIAEETLLIQLFSELKVSNSAWADHSLLTSRTRFGAMCSNLEPDC